MNYRTVQDIEEEMEQYQEQGNLGKVMDLVDELGNLGDRLVKACAETDWSDIEFLNEEIGMDLTESVYLKVAAKYGQTEVIKYLVQQGSDIHAENDAALHTAVINDQLKSVQCLVTLGADVHALDERAIKDAARNDFLEIVKFLAGSGASIEAVIGLGGLEDCHQEVYEWAVAYKEAKNLKESLEESLSEGEDEVALPKTKI